MSEDRHYLPGSLGFHEVVYAANTRIAEIECEILEHPSVRNNTLWLAMATEAVATLRRLEVLLVAEEDRFFEMRSEAAE